MPEKKSVYALNLFNILDKKEYLAYVKQSAVEVASHGGKVVALGKYKETLKGEIAPRSVMIVVEWESREAFQSYLDAPELKEMHAHREKGTENYIWHLFDRLEDFRPLLK